MTPTTHHSSDTTHQAGVNPEDVRIVAAFAEAFVAAVEAGDLDTAVTAARTLQDSVDHTVEALDPEGVCSAAVTHSNGGYLGAGPALRAATTPTGPDTTGLDETESETFTTRQENHASKEERE